MSLDTMNLNQDQTLEGILESAVVVSWQDLMRGAQSGLIHIEYAFAPGGTLDYLKLWSSIAPGHWLLACEYWMTSSTFHDRGVRFDNGYESQDLAHILESVMRHQDSFSLPTDFGRQGLLQIPTPTEEVSTAAAASVSEAFDHLGSAFAGPALA
jgi:hypothetical protein